MSADNPDARSIGKLREIVLWETGAHGSHFMYIKRRSLPNIVSWSLSRNEGRWFLLLEVEISVEYSG